MRIMETLIGKLKAKLQLLELTHEKTRVLLAPGSPRRFVDIKKPYRALLSAWKK